MIVPKDKIRMNRIVCSPENSVLECDLELAVRQQTLNKIQIAETPEGFYVIAQFKWADNKKWYLTTRRKRTEPRLFKDLIRLNNLLRESYPTEIVEILRNQTLLELNNPPPSIPVPTDKKTKSKKTIKNGDL